MQAHERTGPHPLREGPSAAVSTRERTTTSHIVGPSAPFVNACMSTRGDSERTRRDSERLEGLAMFAVTIGAALFLIVHVLAHSWGWQGAALAMTAGECLTLVLVAVTSDRGVRR